jgi:serine/threonine protein kinase
MSSPRWRLLRRIGRGGMAEVWLAQGADGQRVALKRVLAEHAVDPRFVRMFSDEAAIAGALDHPGIVRVLAHGVEDGAPWIALELVDGEDAASLGARGRERGTPMPELAALWIAAHVGRALHAAHEARDEDGEPRAIVHRDVTPGNVLVARDGTVKLGDFGIAKARDRLERTSAGVTKGKMAFMAPEQMLGGELDRRADVFGLGCTLHALLTGRSAIRDERDGATLMSGAELTLDPSLADDVSTIIARAVKPSRVQRWPTAAAMAGAIEGVLAERGSDARESLVRWIAGLGERELPIEAPRRSWGVIAAVVSIAVAVALGITIAWSAGEGVRPITRAVDAGVERITAPIARVDAGVLAVDAGAASSIEPAIDAGRPRLRARRDAGALPAAPPPETGFVIVGGPGAARRVVYVDGRRRDFAPLTIELPIGAHTLEVREPDGTTVASRAVTLREDHTRHSPMRWLVEP